MEIKVKSIFIGDSYWEDKCLGVILVQKKEDIEPLWNLLCEQDSYWSSYKHLIKVAPSEISSVKDIIDMCEYNGKTDIYEPSKIYDKIPFLMYCHRCYVDY